MSSTTPVQVGTPARIFGGGTVTASITGVTQHSTLLLVLRWQKDGSTTPPATPTNEAWVLPAGGAPAGVTCKGVTSYSSGVAVYYIADAAAGNHTAVINSGGSADVLDARIIELNLGVTSGVFDVLASSSTPGGTPATSGVSGTSAATSTSQPNSFQVAVIGAAGLSSQSTIGLTAATPTAPTANGWTSVASLGSSGADENSSSTLPGDISYRNVTSGSTASASWAWTTSGEYMGLVITFKATASVTLPIITSPAGGTSIANGSSLTLTGTTFGGTQGTGSVSIGGSATQTETAWADTSVTIGAIARGALAYGATSIALTNGAGNPSAGVSITLTPQAGWAYVTLGTPNTTAANRVTASPDLVAGDQVAYDTQGGLVVMNTDGTFTADPSVVSFNFEVWTTGSGWGSAGTATLQSTPTGTVVVISW